MFNFQAYLRRRSDSNRRIKVLQTFALDRLATAPYIFIDNSYALVHPLKG